MGRHDELVERFESHRSHLRALAYRILGSLGEAEGAVHEARLRRDRRDVGRADNLGGWLTALAIELLDD